MLLWEKNKLYERIITLDGIVKEICLLCMNVSWSKLSPYYLLASLYTFSARIGKAICIILIRAPGFELGKKGDRTDLRWGGGGGGVGTVKGLKSQFDQYTQTKGCMINFSERFNSKE